MKKKKHSDLRGFAEYIIVVAFLRILTILPYRIASDTGSLIGRLGYLLDKKNRNIALENLARAFPDRDKKDIAGIAGKVFENLGRSAAEFVHIASQPPDSVKRMLNKWVIIEGQNYVNNAIMNNKGIIYLGAHFGNWELLGQVLSTNKCTFNVIARPIDNRRLNRIIISLRSVLGANVLLKKGVLRDTLRVLKKGGAVGILLDQNTSREEGVFVDYFGQPAATNKGLALIAMKSGASVIPVFIVREDTYRHRVVYLPEIEIKRSDNLERDVITYTKKFTSIIESFVRDHPEQWFWMHRRWKTMPLNENSP